MILRANRNNVQYKELMQLVTMAVIVTFILLLKRNVVISQTTEGCVANYHSVNGECTECPAGFYGINCNGRCPRNFYGKDCLYTCQDCEWADCDPVIGCQKVDVCDEICKSRKEAQNGSHCTTEDDIAGINMSNCGLQLAMMATVSVMLIVAILVTFGLVIHCRKKKKKLPTKPQTSRALITSNYYADVNEEGIEKQRTKEETTPAPTSSRGLVASNYYADLNEEGITTTYYKSLSSEAETSLKKDSFEHSLNDVNAKGLTGEDIETLTNQIYEKLTNSEGELTCEYAKLREVVEEEVARVVK